MNTFIAFFFCFLIKCVMKSCKMKLFAGLLFCKIFAFELNLYSFSSLRVRKFSNIYKHKHQIRSHSRQSVDCKLFIVDIYSYSGCGAVLLFLIYTKDLLPMMILNVFISCIWIMPLLKVRPFFLRSKWVCLLVGGRASDSWRISIWEMKKTNEWIKTERESQTPFCVGLCNRPNKCIFDYENEINLSWANIHSNVNREK